MNNINNNIGSSFSSKTEALQQDQTNICAVKENKIIESNKDLTYKTNITKRQINNKITSNTDNTSNNIDNENTTTNFEQEALFINKSDLSDLPFISEKEIESLDLAEYYIISNTDIKNAFTSISPDTNEYHLKNFILECINKTYKILTNNFISIKINTFMLSIFKLNTKLQGLNEINMMLDSFNNQEIMTEYLIIELSKLDKDHFYQILISQINAKLFYLLSKEGGFIKILYDIYLHIKNASTDMTCTNNVYTLKKLILYSLNTMINETAEYIIDEKNIAKLASDITENQLKYINIAMSNEELQEQFIKDAVRTPQLSFSLVENENCFWNTESEDMQQLNLQTEHIVDHLEKIKHGEKIFNLCQEKLSQFLLNFSSDKKDQLINAILLELTQAGAATASSIMLGMQYNLKKTLYLSKNYLCESVSHHERTTTIKIEYDNIVITTSINFFPGIFIKGESNNFIIDSKPINITTSLLLNNNEIAYSKYNNIQIKYV